MSVPCENSSTCDFATPRKRFGRHFHSPLETVRFIVTWDIGGLIASSFWVTSFIHALTKIPKSIFILSSKIWWMSFFPFHFPVLSSFNPSDGPLNTSSTVSFGLQSCPYTGGFKTCLKVWWKGFWENNRIVKWWFFCLYMEWSFWTVRTCKGLLYVDAHCGVYGSCN